MKYYDAFNRANAKKQVESPKLGDPTMTVDENKSTNSKIIA